MTDRDPRFARSPHASVFGECDDRLDIPLPGELRDRLMRLAALEGKSTATWAREQLERAVLFESERVKHIVAKSGGDPQRMNLG